MPEGDSPARAETTLVAVHQDEVLTGEAVALDVQPLGFFMRALGALIDVLLGVALFLMFALVMAWLAGVNVVASGLSPILSIVMLVIVAVVVPTVVETATHGRSLGRLAVGGRIVRADGGASGFRQALIRALLGVLEIWLTVGAVAALVGAFTPRSQRLGDLVAGTYSERTRAPKLAPPAPGVPPGLEQWAATADVARLPDALARRLSQFLREQEHLAPSARERLALELLAEARAFVFPLPPAHALPALFAISAVRRARELHALLLEEQRVRALTGGPGRQ